MNRKLLPIFALLFLLTLISNVAADCIQVDGQITSTVTEVWYDNVKFYSFNLTVYHSNTTWQGGELIAVLLDASLVQNIPVIEESYNFTGNLNNNSEDVIPDSAFVVEHVIVQPGPGWMEQITALITLIGSVTAGIVNVVVGLIKMGTGYDVPPFIVTAILATTFVLMLKKYWKVIGLLFAFVLLFLAVSGGAYMLKLLFWH